MHRYAPPTVPETVIRGRQEAKAACVAQEILEVTGRSLDGRLMDVDGSWASLVLLLSSFASLMFLEILFYRFFNSGFHQPASCQAVAYMHGKGIMHRANS